ncbi:hypothetical protein BCR43DRAFT_490298 [Syncephalastrum racemosum]|uniref:Uncharacterized protein n=1 Tax=Syncephalastrum racemosum TaxID=13706 RepID=A0A1X2HFS5_SYNRA|nr:hypothetical protein BCR43DRAFT_490298 [Syncephalastrum racemosum]
MNSLCYDHHSMKEIAHRLKARLALADFKRQHGYEHYDLYTLERRLFERRRVTLAKARRNIDKQSKAKTHHRYYSISAPKSSTIAAKASSPSHAYSATGYATAVLPRLSALRQPATPSPRERMSPSPTLLLRACPLSAQRLPSKQDDALSSSSCNTATCSSDEEDAAHWLVMLRHYHH